jgi:hypothetical protein
LYCRNDWEKRTLIGKFDLIGVTLIKGFEVRVFRDDGSTDVSDPKSNPVIEVTIDVMTFDNRFNKGVTRKNHTFHWEGKIPDKFKPLNREMIEVKIKEMITTS